MRTDKTPLNHVRARDISLGSEPVPVPVEGFSSEALTDLLGDFRTVRLSCRFGMSHTESRIVRGGLDSSGWDTIITSYSTRSRE